MYEITTFSCPPQQSWSHYFAGETQDIRLNNYNNRNSLVAHTVKNLSAVQETQVLSLRWEDLLEKGIPTPLFLPGEFHGQRSLTGYSPWGCKELYKTELLTLIHFQDNDKATFLIVAF